MTQIKMKYFVLKPGGNDNYAKASRIALRAFATEMERDDLPFAAQLKEWAYEEERAVYREALNEVRG